MREHRVEVEQLRQRIHELEGSAYQSRTSTTTSIPSSGSQIALGVLAQPLSSPEGFQGGDIVEEYVFSVGLHHRLALSCWLKQ
jgi:hypothetical protein